MKTDSNFLVSNFLGFLFLFRCIHWFSISSENLRQLNISTAPCSAVRQPRKPALACSVGSLDQANKAYFLGEHLTTNILIFFSNSRATALWEFAGEYPRSNKGIVFPPLKKAGMLAVYCTSFSSMITTDWLGEDDILFKSERVISLLFSKKSNEPACNNHTSSMRGSVRRRGKN